MRPPRPSWRTSADLVHDDHGREGDQPALEGSREELDLAVAIGMVAIGGAPGEDEAAESEERGHHVDDGLESIRQDGRGARHPIGLVLGAEKDHRHDERQDPRA
jgi:hypothetical protein